MTRSAAHRQIGSTDMYVPEIGLGTGSFGGTVDEVGEALAVSMVDYALAHGLTFIDTAPWYGDKVSERYVGVALKKHDRSSYTLATKVTLEFRGDDEHRMYGRDEMLHGLEGSLNRLQHSSVDLLHIHDPIHEAHDRIVNETFPALLELKAQGVTKAISLGTGRLEVAMELVRALPFDAVMLAGRYTLLEQPALDALDELQSRGVSVFSAGLYNSGILATGTKSGVPKYNYQAAPADIIERVQKLEAVCDRHGVRLKAAAAQFVKAHPAITCIVLGADTVEQIQENLAVFTDPIPADFWLELRDLGLVNARVPLPTV